MPFDAVPFRSTSAPRLQVITTNRRCNQACTYCDRRSDRDDLAAIAAPALQRAIREAVARGVEEIRLTGGEPTMRGDLPALVAYARQAGALRVSLETNGTLIDGPRAQALHAAGLTLARVNAVGLDARADAVTRDPGGAARTAAGLQALLAAGIAVEVRAVLTAQTAALLPDLPAALHALTLPGQRVAVLEVAVPVIAPDPADLLDYPACVPVLQQLDAACRAVALPLSLARDSGPPPCVFPSRRGLWHLWALSPGGRHAPGHVPLPACGDCQLADRCPGIASAYLDRHGAPPAQPIVDARERRQLTRSRGLAEQITRELVNHSMATDATGAPVFDAIVRIIFHCNQACAFCFVSTHLPGAQDEQVETAIRTAGASGARILLSGGEPTLHPRLLHWIALAKSVSAHPVCLQTNAVRLDDPARAAAIVAAGVTEAFVSLHGATAEVGDFVTDTPGTFVRSLHGIDNLLALDVRVVLNFVVCQANLAEFPDFVRLVAARWPAATVNFSFVAASTDLVPKEKSLIPKYADVMPRLTEGLAEASRLGLVVTGFDTMCGMPLCLVPPPFDREALLLAAIPDGFEAGEFVKSPACDGCRYRQRCYGVRRGYADLHGTDELVAIV